MPPLAEIVQLDLEHLAARIETSPTLDKGWGVPPGWPRQAALDHLVAGGSSPSRKHGDHAGYARVEASSSEEALALPENERASARAIPLDQFRAVQVKALHHK